MITINELAQAVRVTPHTAHNWLMLQAGTGSARPAATPRVWSTWRRPLAACRVGGIAEKETMDDRQHRAIPPSAVSQAPCVTFRAFRQVAKQHEWSLEWLVEQCQAELDCPTDTIRRVLEGARVEGHWAAGKWIAPYWDDMAEVVLPYRCLIDLYQRATRPTPALAEEKVCRCRCGRALRGRQQFASVACRKRVSRKGVMGQKRATESATDAA